MNSRKRPQPSRSSGQKFSKKLKEDEDMARTYEDFVEAFMAPGDKPDKGIQFTQGGVVNPVTNKMESAMDKGNVKQPNTLIQIGTLPNQGQSRQQEKKNDQLDGKYLTEGNIKKSKQQQPRKIDQILENIMRENDMRKQQVQQQKQAQQQQQQQSHLQQSFQLQQQQQQQIKGTDCTIESGTGDAAMEESDAGSTNLWIGNLAPEVDETVLLREFGRYGKISSVKVMWPRDEEQRQRQRNTGFVAFVDRDQAAEAKDALNGQVLFDQEIKVSWGKSVPVRGAGVTPQQTLAYSAALANGNVTQIEIPTDDRVRYIIDTVAKYVTQDGSDFEILLMQKECKNDSFAFLFNVNCPEHKYYRWRILSLANKDSFRSWRTEPVIPVKHGSYLLPPAVIGAQSTQKNATAAQKGGALSSAPTRATRKLSESERDKFLQILKNLKAERGYVREAMCYALDNSEAVEEVVNILHQMVSQQDTPVNMVVCLFVVSDILHNSATTVAPNASRFREGFQAVLPDMFAEMCKHLWVDGENQDAHVQKSQLKQSILRVLQAWETWRVFPEDFIEELRAKVEGNHQVEQDIIGKKRKQEDEEMEEQDIYEQGQQRQETLVVRQSLCNNNPTGQVSCHKEQVTRSKSARIAMLMDMHHQMNLSTLPVEVNLDNPDSLSVLEPTIQQHLEQREIFSELNGQSEPDTEICVIQATQELQAHSDQFLQEQQQQQQQQQQLQIDRESEEQRDKTQLASKWDDDEETGSQHAQGRSCFDYRSQGGAPFSAGTADNSPNNSQIKGEPGETLLVQDNSKDSSSMQNRVSSNKSSNDVAILHEDDASVGPQQQGHSKHRFQQSSSYRHNQSTSHRKSMKHQQKDGESDCRKKLHEYEPKCRRNHRQEQSKKGEVRREGEPRKRHRIGELPSRDRRRR